jgi:hypothetical protein
MIQGGPRPPFALQYAHSCGYARRSIIKGEVWLLPRLDFGRGLLNHVPRQRAAGLWRHVWGASGTRNSPASEAGATVILEFLVNHNWAPLPCFFKSVHSKGG